MYQNCIWQKNSWIIPLSCFLVSWSSWRYHLWSWALVCIQVLESTFWAFTCEGEIVINFPPQMNVQIEWVLEQYLRCTTNYHQNNWSKLLAMAKFTFNNIMHSLTQQIFFFVNHGLHPKFDIQGVHNVVNPTVGDWTLWSRDASSTCI